ncbi:hypothetical protein M422DRAFT_253256 [Sphaerobolus stellatus SS14]|uniref:Uncharacterized protein n=1 Tax=Sphaerobolus stellatus (strain SS14) TaxID=990650 RepID=A0A0C9V8R5_SPHS4|nr:hypothetical protein M422DRAFT_253256 [Sphaerobolus stellatus SS14]
MYVSTLTRRLRPRITPRYLRAASTSSCNIPPPFPAAIAAACSTNTPQLYALASGYGFVLFDIVDAAQKCIDVLRSHHNLHPTFAKQAHKIARSPPLVNITNPHPSAAAYVSELALAHSNSYPHLASTSNSSIGMTMGGAVGMDGPTLLPTPPVAPQAKLKLKDRHMYQDIYAAPQATQQQDTNNTVGSSGNVHNATGARRDHPNTNVNANRNGVGGGGAYQSQSQSPEGVGVGGVGGPGRMSMGGGYGISVEPFWHTLQGLEFGARYEHTTRSTPGTGSATVPPPLQPISATLNQLQLQLFTIRRFSKGFEVLAIELTDYRTELSVISFSTPMPQVYHLSLWSILGNEDLRRAAKIWSSVKELYFQPAFHFDLNMSGTNPFHDIFFFACFSDDLEVIRIISTNLL